MRVFVLGQMRLHPSPKAKLPVPIFLQLQKAKWSSCLKVVPNKKHRERQAGEESSHQDFQTQRLATRNQEPQTECGGNPNSLRPSDGGKTKSDSRPSPTFLD